MDEDVVKFEDYDIEIDLKEIDNMDEEELKKCKAKIKEIKEMINKN